MSPVFNRHSLRFSLFLVASDIVLVALSLRLAVLARTVVPVGRTAPTYEVPFVVNIITVVLFSVIYIAYGLYDARRTRSLTMEFQHIVTHTFLAWFTLAGIMYFSFRDVSRLLMIYFLVSTLVLIATYRAMLRVVSRRTRGRSFDARGVIIIGSGTLAKDAQRALAEHSWSGVFLVDEMSSGQITNIPAFIENLTGRMETDRVSDIIITEDTADEHITALIKALHKLSLDIHLIPDLRDLIFLNAGTTTLDTLPLITLKSPTLDPFQRLVKRTFDVLASAAMILMTAPLMLIVGLAVFLSEPGSPIFFIQERVGEHMKPLHVIKFRTMTHNAAEKHAKQNAGKTLDQVQHKMLAASDVTPLGRFLRRTALDELPQLFNVLMGDMSLVGPRPEIPWLVEKYESWQIKRFEVPQGLTGWWQVTRAHDSLMHLNTDADLYYIQNYSLWLDIRILLMTVPAVLRGRGAY